MTRLCGVPMCNNYSSTTISLHQIPKEDLDSPLRLAKWRTALKIGTKFSNRFVICSEHFDEKQILRAILSGKKRLVRGAFPTRNLPGSLIRTNKKKALNRTRQRKVRVAKANDPKHSDDEISNNIETLPICTKEYASIGIQCPEFKIDKSVQVNSNSVYNVTSLWNSDYKLFTMTGIPTLRMLDVMTNMCINKRPNDKCIADFRTKILITMRKLKSNCTFADIAILFQINEKIAKRYFADTIQLLAKGMKGLIHWQTREQNEKKLPKCFANVKTVLHCQEFKTVTSKFLSCRTSTYSHYKGGHTLKVLIGVSPSGIVNYISPVAIGKSTDKDVFNLTDLQTKLEPGDVVMVDKGFLMADELAKAGIEMVDRSTKIASASVHVKRRIGRLKQMKVLSKRLCSSITPYMDEIMIVACALSNLSAPILSDDEF